MLSCVDHTSDSTPGGLRRDMFKKKKAPVEVDEYDNISVLRDFAVSHELSAHSGQCVYYTPVTAGAGE